MAPPPQYYNRIEVIPRLPDPYSYRIYRLQVGAFSSPEMAMRTIQMLQSAGFYVAQEMYGSLYRILVVGIPAADVYAVVQRLELMGFRQVWVKE
jgi:cell division septation protein DedD